MIMGKLVSLLVAPPGIRLGKGLRSSLGHSVEFHYTLFPFSTAPFSQTTARALHRSAGISVPQGDNTLPKVDVQSYAATGHTKAK